MNQPRFRPRRATAAERQAQTRAAVVDAAIETFREFGYSRASLDEISGRAGYSTGAVYSNFAGKDGLFLACLEVIGRRQGEQWEELFGRIERGGLDYDDLSAVLRAVIPDRAWRRAVVEFTVLPKSGEAQTRLLEIQRGWRAVIHRLIETILASRKHGPTSYQAGPTEDTSHEQPMGTSHEPPMNTSHEQPSSVEDTAEIVAALIDGLMIAAQVDTDISIDRLAATTIQRFTS